jgi:4-diphosphocytidyl-2-C-methyl-D-erythritol kinase
MRMTSKTQGADPLWMRVRTPAKVSIALQVLGKRKDGYHEVSLVLVPVSLYDTLAFCPEGENPLSLEVDSKEDLGRLEDNLVWRAAAVFQEATGMSLNDRILLAKHIPSGAGLGGGSGNAAGTLVALNALHGRPLAPQQLQVLAATLGSDVPFFVDPHPATCEGRGERLTPFAGFPSLPLLIVKPPFSIGTAEAYRALAQSRSGPAPVSPQPMPKLTTVDTVVSALHNDFEPVLFKSHPELAEIRDTLRKEGAAGAVLSGSGSAVFGIYRDPAARDGAAQRVRADRRWAVFPCETLTGHTYEFES